jgi:ethanolamine ammonia-lyase small subunit
MTRRNNPIVPDITAGTPSDLFLVPNSADRSGYLRLKAATSARIGVGRAGARYATLSMLRFRADHAGARDSVNADVPESFVLENGFISVVSRCDSRETYLRRPDFGRRLSDESRESIRKNFSPGADVLIAVGDGLSSAAIRANAAEVIPAVRQGLALGGVETGPVLFVKYCRVGIMDDIAPLIDVKVVCLLIGERPGLVSAESMSAYMAFRPNFDRPESWRSVVSNIHGGGIPPVEAGAQIAEILIRMLEQECSGLSLVW